jgi:hypothetical protein
MAVHALSPFLPLFDRRCRHRCRAAAATRRRPAWFDVAPVDAGVPGVPRRQVLRRAGPAHFF